MRHALFLLLFSCLVAGKANAQSSLHIEGYSPIALEDLGVLADGTGFGGLVAVTYPFMDSDMIDLVAKAGFNHYGTRKEEILIEGDIAIDIDAAYQAIPITGGARIYYGSKRYYVEGLIGVEIKRGDFDFRDLEDETYKTDVLASIGGGITVVRGLSVIASFSFSHDLWRYASLGLSYSFGR